MMIPQFPNTGCGGAIAGLLALQIGEFCHSWSLIEGKWKGVAKLMLLTFMVFGLGMLPGVRYPFEVISVADVHVFISQ